MPCPPVPDAARTSALPLAAGAALFRSFWMGGYEGADHVNSQGVPLRTNHHNGHARWYAHDYAAAARLGLRTVRESIGWRAGTRCDGTLDVQRLQRLADAAQRHGLQVVWTLHHYGLPPGVDFFAPGFAPRFADFCDRVARALRGRSDAPPVFQPINEISFLSWAVGSSDLVHPYRGGSAQRGYELKCRLVAAALQGCDALWATEPRARMVHTDPLIHVVPDTACPAPDGSGDPEARARWAAEAQALTESQFEAWDMLCGRREPGLGGAPRYLDVLGINYYHSNQWAHPSNQRLHWHLGDARRRGLDALLATVWQRYGRPLFIAETGHVGAGRARWLDDVARAAERALSQGVPLQGICLYPLLDRPDWEDPTHWHRSGLWEVPQAAAAFRRVLDFPYARQLRRWQRALPAVPTAPGAAPRAGPASLPLPEATPMNTTTLIVFSHLRWDFVYQRPQQLMSRLARRMPVLFVEEPVPGAASEFLEVMDPEVGVRVLRPHVSSEGAGFHDAHTQAVQALLATYLQEHAVQRYWLWFYTPMALPLAERLQPEGVVYDCMDELSAFRFAPPELLQRENALFACADLVFTGGHSLYESKRTRHPNVHCFPSSVDAAHFARALQSDHAAQAHLPHPRLGYCGVIDERIDLDLVAALADAHPRWQIVMVGPVVKIDPATLPQRANLHWLGQRDYAELPELIGGWEVCLMPFALNPSTRFISPTKTLEYLAAGRPVVSTPICDVAGPYAGIVSIAASRCAFVAACAAALALSPAARARQAEAVRALLSRTSWDGTATAMANLIEQHRAPRPAARPAQPRRQPATAPQPQPVARTPATAGRPEVALRARATRALEGAVPLSATTTAP
ncbi:glycosyltransferase [Acidovorax sp. SRB_24]|uniref:glycosyltransferase n=1 Tax=Acidovorax sp. SRB_24 TaxID=1962700 RepID=UPI001F0D1919|nr:glycosyltransferase [Acidovorax sp. SRB_24]